MVISHVKTNSLLGLREEIEIKKGKDNLEDNHISSKIPSINSSPLQLYYHITFLQISSELIYQKRRIFLQVHFLTL